MQGLALISRLHCSLVEPLKVKAAHRFFFHGLFLSPVYHSLLPSLFFIPFLTFFFSPLIFFITVTGTLPLSELSPKGRFSTLRASVLDVHASGVGLCFYFFRFFEVIIKLCIHTLMYGKWLGGRSVIKRMQIKFKFLFVRPFILVIYIYPSITMIISFFPVSVPPRQSI